MAKTPQDLVGRTFHFARDVRSFVNNLPRLFSTYEDVRQVLRSSGSVAANYIESQEGLSRKDFFYRIKACRKESRESGLWLRLLNLGNEETVIKECTRLIIESDELKKIFAAIAAKDDTD